MNSESILFERADATQLPFNPNEVDLALLDGIPDEKHGAVLRCLRARVARFNKGETLAGGKVLIPYTRYLVKGDAQLIRTSNTGIRSILGVYEEGTVVSSELTPYFLGKNELEIRAVSSCVTLDFFITQETEGCPCCVKYINHIRRNLIEAFADQNMQLMQRLNTLANRSARERILSFLREQSRDRVEETFRIPYNRQELADLLYLERSALSRELSNMQRDGLISFDKDLFTIHEQSLN